MNEKLKEVNTQAFIILHERSPLKVLMYLNVLHIYFLS